MRRRAEKLSTQEWHPLAALYHYQLRGPETRAAELPSKTLDYGSLEVEEDEIVARHIEKHGPAPSPFLESPNDTPRIALPSSLTNGDFFDILKRRKSIRNFDSERLLGLESLSTLLYWVFGCHGWTRLAPEVTLIHRTSASGGSRHPIEIYPLVLRVDGLAPGLYHYEMRNHALEPIREIDLETAQALATESCEGQTWAGACHVLFLMTARFYRNYWKYPQSQRTYNVILMDAGHLSQTFYLTAAKLGLGAFYSAAINNAKLEKALDLDAYEEGVIAVCGCGIKAPGKDFSLPFEPFEPGKTSI